MNVNFSRISSGLVGLAATIAAGLLIAPTVADADQSPGETVRDLEDIYARANAALLRGDANEWKRLVPLSQDFVLMSPFGGTPSRFEEYTPERIARMGRFFRNGDFRQEIVQSFATDDMIVLATIERSNVEVGGLPAQDWALRVTSVFRRQGSDWVLAHRHADPIVEEVSLPEAARLSRGERMPATK